MSLPDFYRIFEFFVWHPEKLPGRLCPVYDANFLINELSL
jgi:hypothetical protein